MAYKYDFSMTQSTSNYDRSIWEFDSVITLCSFINTTYPFTLHNLKLCNELNTQYIL